MFLLDILQLVTAVLLVLLVLMQNQGAGMGAAFGGGDATFHTRRGPEKTVFILTIVVAIAFLVIAFLNALL